MPQSGIDPLRPQRLPYRTEAGILRLRIGAGIRTGLIGTGKMRKNPGGAQVFSAVHRRDSGRLVSGKPDAVHAGVHLDMHLHRHAGLRSALCQRMSIFRGIYRLGQTLLRELPRIFTRRHAKDQNRLCNAVAPQYGGLFNI